MNIKLYLLLPFLLSFTVKQSGDPFRNFSWRTIEATGQPASTEENDFINIGSKFYLVGGRTIQKMSVFDPATQAWSFVAAPPVEMHHFQSVVYNGELYVCMAMTGNYPHETPLPNIYIYNPGSDQWRKGPEIPEARRRGSAGIVVYKNKIYMVNGIQDGHWTGHVTWFDEYDPKTNTWKQLPDSPVARDHFGAAVVGDKLYCIAGRQSNGKEGKVFEQTIDQVDVYDFSTGTWKTLPAQLPTPRAGAAVIAVGKDILIIGGESAQQLPAHNEVDAFNVTRGEFRSLPHLVTGRHGTGVGQYKGKIYTAGGAGNRGGSPKLTSIEVFEETR